MDELFWSKVDITGECWLWMGYRNANGYGWLNRRGKHSLAHRYSYIEANGPTESNILHKCDNPACVRPSHLTAGTQADNLRDMHNKGRYVSAMRLRTHCPQGHPYSGDNLFVDNRGWRQCRACRKRRVKSSV